jgi:hypothetical protein
MGERNRAFVLSADTIRFWKTFNPKGGHIGIFGAVSVLVSLKRLPSDATILPHETGKMGGENIDFFYGFR